MLVYGSAVMQVFATGRLSLKLKHLSTIKKLGDWKFHNIRLAWIHIDWPSSYGTWPRNPVLGFLHNYFLLGMCNVVSTTVKYKNETTHSIHCSNGLVFLTKFTI